MVTFSSKALAVLIGLVASPVVAQDVPVLHIYTYDGFAAEWGPGPKLSAGFEAICGGCKVEWIAADSSIGTLRRVQLEGDSTEADLIVGLDTAIAGEARDTGLFAQHGLALEGLALPKPGRTTPSCRSTSRISPSSTTPTACPIRRARSKS